MSITLAVTYHDPEGRLYEPARHMLPVLTEIFDGLVVQASPAANERSLGLEFETADRYMDEVVAAGGRAQWLAQLDADPRRWAHRLHLARLEVEAMLPYAPKGPDDRAE